MIKYLYRIKQSTKTLPTRDITVQVARYVLDPLGSQGDIVGFTQKADARYVLAFYVAGIETGDSGWNRMDEIRARAHAFSSVCSRGRLFSGSSYYYVAREPVASALEGAEGKVSICLKSGVEDERDVDYDDDE